VFVEGQSDRLALESLWKAWKERLRDQRHGIAIIPLDDKSRFFRKIGHHAGQVLVGGSQDVAVGLPDLYPNASYDNTIYKHRDVAELKQVQVREVKRALREVFGKQDPESQQLLQRFFPSALKHDLEMLLLAAKQELTSYLRVSGSLGSWRLPVEDQNQQRPPKRVVEELFRTKKGWAYRDTIHASAVLGKVTDLRGLLFNQQKQVQCPVFKETLDWIGAKTGIPAY
ncbi:MAG: DUF4276 family protein, partial [Planctomycetota bacterium]|nr:DUF4276 family protein [Planctomycetota bacterium]